MWPAVVFFSLFAATAVAFFLFYRRHLRVVAALHKARERVELEETRVFDFLHGLGAALSERSRPSDLHLLIVEGALRILNGESGALYIISPNGQVLQPMFVSRNCPPLFEVPENVATEGGKGKGILHNYIRLHQIKPGEGVIGSVWRDKEPLLLRGEDGRLDPARHGPRRTSSIMVTPLIYGGQTLGVLLITRAEGTEPFLKSEFQIFKAIAEQSAFALSTAIIFSDAAEKKRLDEDLQVAYDIQRILLPTNAPDIAGFEIAGINIPARQVSGDYFDYVRVDPNHCGIAIADVSGKGVPASLIMATCRSVLRSQAPERLSAAEVLHRVNAQMFPDIKEDMFISMAYAVLEQDSSTVTLARAGHDAPLHYSAATRRVARINPPGMAIGIDSGGVFNRVTGDYSFSLERDDCLIFYTDGVTEALDRDGEEFGMDRLIQAILASAGVGAAGIITRLTDDLRTFIGTQPQHDDVTLVVVRKK
jgi:sigma-B regulation protein RsbU (phosphoserine phosphatase)